MGIGEGEGDGEEIEGVEGEEEAGAVSDAFVFRDLYADKKNK